MGYNIVLAGVGGQGIITSARILADAVLASGGNVLVAETHGLSQRGGSVVVHVRVGDVEAPLIPPGMGDLLIGLEAIEAARYVNLLKPGSPITVNAEVQPPPLPKITVPSLDKIIKALGEAGYTVYSIPATTEASKLGDARSMNTLLLGYASGLGLLDQVAPPEALAGSVARVIRRSSIAVKAFWHGFKLATAQSMTTLKRQR
ncbi:MAG: 2-oxoacid:acceptor oxidoreductase family protein [Desulfurococcales archaeon]|nr:2-oxoacid:acceptor oxidoreductase family protein [Desulfurococcales archaeon]